MIEILFRGIIKYPDDIFKGFWHGNLIIYANGDTFIRQIETGQEFEVIPESVGEFTGLTDKNGVKIFSDDLLKDGEGDIFRIYQIDGGFCIKSSVWKTDINDFDFTDILIAASLTDAQMQSYILESCEIVGNIHDKHVL